MWKETLSKHWPWIVGMVFAVLSTLYGAMREAEHIQEDVALLKETTATQAKTTEQITEANKVWSDKFQLCAQLAKSKVISFSKCTHQAQWPETVPMPEDDGR